MQRCVQPQTWNFLGIFPWSSFTPVVDLMVWTTSQTSILNPKQRTSRLCEYKDIMANMAPCTTQPNSPRTPSPHEETQGSTNSASGQKGLIVPVDKTESAKNFGRWSEPMGSMPFCWQHDHGTKDARCQARIQDLGQGAQIPTFLH